jgi:hypothetical protein
MSGQFSHSQIAPTGPESATTIHNDTALTQLYSCYIQLINSERQAIWQRFAAMIMANSFLIGFLSRDNTTGVAIAVTGCGFAVTIFWLLMTVRAWVHFFRLYKAAQAFSWLAFPGINPTLIDLPGSYTWWRDIVFLSALATIAVFLFLYMGLAYYFAGSLLAKWWVG